MNTLPRRRFLAQSVGVLAALAGSLALAEKAAGPDRDAPAVAIELAALGAALRESQPEVAAQLESAARAVTGFDAARPIDWESIERARIKLTDPQRTAKELQDAAVVFAAGWLLTHSEAGAVLLYDSAVRGQHAPTNAPT